MSHTRVTYTPRTDATHEGELNALASIYSFVLTASREKEGGPPTAPDSAEGGSENDSSAKSRIP